MNSAEDTNTSHSHQGNYSQNTNKTAIKRHIVIQRAIITMISNKSKAAIITIVTTTSTNNGSSPRRHKKQKINSSRLRELLEVLQDLEAQGTS